MTSFHVLSLSSTLTIHLLRARAHLVMGVKDKNKSGNFYVCQQILRRVYMFNLSCRRRVIFPSYSSLVTEKSFLMTHSIYDKFRYLTGLFSFHTFASFPPGWHINSFSLSPFLRVLFPRSILMWEMTSLGSSVNWVSLDAQHGGGRKKYLHNRAPDVGEEKSFIFSRKETSSLFNIFHITQAAL